VSTPQPFVQRSSVRLIARLDIKAPNLVKGIHLEGLRVMGDPAEHALRYYSEGIDELIYVDIVASLYNRNNIVDLVERTANQVFVPLTVGGGVRTLDDFYRLLRAGADKVALNTGAIHNPELLGQASRVFGAQCVVLSVEAKRRPAGGWEAYTDNGREKTGRDAIAWIREAVDRGAGEILLTSIDNEGTKRGFDLPLYEAIATQVPVPVIACGGAGSVADIASVVNVGADAVAIASLLHYRTETVQSAKATMRTLGIGVR